MTRGATVIDELRTIQDRHGHLPVVELQQLSRRLRVPLYELQGVASFYPHFRLLPPPDVDVLICEDLVCHLRGAGDLAREVAGRVARDGPSNVTTREGSCLGQCDRAPACSINDVVVGGATADSVCQLIAAAANLRRPPVASAVHSPVPLAADPYDGADPYAAFKQLLASGDAAGTIATLKASGLRGMGGAGFGTGQKWEIVRNAPGDEKYVVCNADESEPGTIKDRFLLDNSSHLVVEGMLVAGAVTGAETGIVYIRHEYEPQRERLEAEIRRCRSEGLLGASILGSRMNFELTVFVSPGGYICGEESALLEALEGKRAEPRNKPPFPGTHGLHGKPTLINNVETFALVPAVLRKGAEWFRAQGRAGATGLKFVGVSGDVARPGVFEIALGTTAREVIFDLAGGIPGGRPLKAFAPSGASSGFLPASKVDVPLDFGPLRQEHSMLGSGALVVCAEGRCMLDLALNAIRFFRRESCGKCVPCRVGSAKMVDVLAAIAGGDGREADVLLIDDLSEAIASTSICGLGQVVPSPIRSVLAHFRPEVEAHILEGRCPSGVCPTVRPGTTGG